MKLLFRHRQRWDHTPTNLSGPQTATFTALYQLRGETNALRHVRRLKALIAGSTQRHVDKSIYLFRSHLCGYGPVSDLQEFDAIIPLPSSFALVNLMLERMDEALLMDDLPEPKIIRNYLKKLTCEEVARKMNWSKIEHEATSCERTSERAESIFWTLLNKGTKLFEIKDVTASFRRYISHFITADLSHSQHSIVQSARNILLVDDTMGHGVTMAEAHRVISEINPTASVCGFCLVHDFPCKTKSIRKFVNEYPLVDSQRSLLTV